MTDARLTAEGAETLVTATPDARVSALGAETLVTATPAARLSTIGLEVLCVLETDRIAYIGIYAQV